MSNLIITSEKKTYIIETCVIRKGKTFITDVFFRSGWQMISYLSGINAEAQKN